MLYKIILLCLLILILLLSFQKVSAYIQPWSMPTEEVCKVVVCEELSIKEKIASVFWDEPRMVNVIMCESGHNQFDEFGKPLISSTSDVGVMQINQVHWKEAKALGLNIFYSIDDNIKMGRLIYNEQGIKAWYAIYSDCYKKFSSLSL